MGVPLLNKHCEPWLLFDNLLVFDLLIHDLLAQYV